MLIDSNARRLERRLERRLDTQAGYVGGIPRLIHRLIQTNANRFECTQARTQARIVGWIRRRDT